MTEPRLSREPIPFTLLADEALKLTRRHFRAIYPAVAIPVALLYGGMGVFQIYWMSSMGAMIEAEPADPMAALEQVMGQGCGFLLAVLALSVLAGLGYVAMMAGATDAVAGRPVRMGERWAWVFTPRVFGTQILAGLAIGLSFICCFLPGLYVLPLLSLVVPVMVQEQAFGGDALKRSAALTRYNPRGQWGETALVKALLMLVIGVALSVSVSLIVQMPLAIIQQVAVFREAAAGNEAAPFVSAWNWLQVPAQVLGSLASTAVSLYMSFAWALLYFDTRARKEGTDLEAAIGAMTAEPVPPAPPLPPAPGTAPR